MQDGDSKVLNILIVDDDAVDVMNVKRAFKKANITNPVWVADNGVDALRILREGAVPSRGRLILLDLNMPRMNGIEFLRELRADPALATVNELEDADGVRAEISVHPPDCLLLDLQLPRVDGVELLRELRADGVDTPVIILTGHGDEQTAVDLMKAGATDYLSKSALSPDRLSKAISHAVRAVEGAR